MSYHDLCLSCHRSLIAGKEYVHSPVGEGECTFCHNSHSSANRALLTEPFPETFYAEASSENFILCFSCHDSDLLLSPTTDYATNFREKQENLHFLHIKGQKGRNCFVCHDMHASTLPHILRNSITFGEWTMKVDFIPAENGGTCYSGCHGPKSYSRE
ncbi:MAG: cytochrome c3 family protein [Bacteroidales bacterium]